MQSNRFRLLQCDIRVLLVVRVGIVGESIERTTSLKFNLSDFCGAAKSLD